MSMRITTKAIMQGYNRDLTNALSNWNKAQKKVLTQRNFTTIAESPSGANRAFKLRRQFRNNNMQLELTQQSVSLMEQASSSAMQISKIMTETVNPDILKAVNGTNSALDVRKAYAQSIRGMRDSIVLAANSQISGRFVFSGASTKEVPFVLDESTGKLTYRGIDVDATDTELYLNDNGNPVFFDNNGEILQESVDYDPNMTEKEITFYDKDGNKINTYSTDRNDGYKLKDAAGNELTYDADGKPVGLVDKAGNTVTEYAKEKTKYTLKNADDYLSTQPVVTKDAEGNVIPDETENVFTKKGALDWLASETLYVDLGFGLEEDGSSVLSTSAFNVSLPGISVLGYGLDENGNSNNVVTLLGQIADLLEQEEFNEDAYGKLMDKYADCIDQVTDFEASLGTKQQFLDGTVTRLEQYNDSINERLVSIEQVDMAEAISTYTWMGYAYNAALKVGTDIVSNSLLDYMK